MLASPAPLITPYDPGQSDSDDLLLGMDLERSLDQYVADRRRLCVRLRSLTAANCAKTWQHGEYSHYSVFIMCRHLALHDFLPAYPFDNLLLRTQPAKA